MQDNVNEPVAAYAELERSGSKSVNGTMSFGGLRCYSVGKIIYLTRLVFC